METNNIDLVKIVEEVWEENELQSGVYKVAALTAMQRLQDIYEDNPTGEGQSNTAMKINRDMTNENPNYLGYDEDHNGDWGNFFMCPKCRENNYITVDDTECKMCGEKIEWVG